MIYLGADHGGYELKEKIKQWLGEWGLEFEDLGAHKLDPDDDYPQFSFNVAEKVGKQDKPHQSWSKRAKGILVCRSSAGMVIAANKIKNVRAAGAVDVKSVVHSREHNDANVLALSGDWLGDAEAKQLIRIWLDTEFSREARHVRRIKQITEKETSH